MMLASIILAASLLENAQAITNYSAQIDAAIVAKGGTTRGGLTNAVAGINSIPSVAKVFFECDVIPLVTTVNDTSSTFYHAFIGETCKIPVEYGTTIRLYNSLPAQWLILHEYDANGNYVDHWRHYPDKMVYPNCYRDITITHANTAYIQSDVAYIGNNVSTFYIQNLNTGEVLFSNGKSHQSKGLCFTAETAGSTVSMVTNGSAPSISLETSRTGFAPWTPFTVNSTTITLTNAGDKVFFRAGNDTGNPAISNIDGMNRFVMTGAIKASGNINSLFKRDPSTISALNDYCYVGMFSGCTSLTTAPELPATNLAASCYNAMFSGCTSLTTAPKLPAKNLASSCYSYMFYGCTSLTTAPELPAKNLAASCYYFMFDGCTSLENAPELPATDLANGCYCFMFSGCTSLTTAPELPATNLTNECYCLMFYGCTSLTTAPELPATNLAASCYNAMFSGCTSLTTAPKLPATNLAASCYSSMFSGCTSLTTAPELPATNLAASCYNAMFYECTSLENAPELHATIASTNCYWLMFGECTSLTTAPELPAKNLADGCYYCMFYECTALTTAPELPATNLADSCYVGMFYGCTLLTDIYTKQNSFTGCYEWLPNKSGATFHCSPSLTIPSPRSTSNVPPDWDIDKTYE